MGEIKPDKAKRELRTPKELEADGYKLTRQPGHWIKMEGNRIVSNYWELGAAVEMARKGGQSSQKHKDEERAVKLSDAVIESIRNPNDEDKANIAHEEMIKAASYVAAVTKGAAAVTAISALSAEIGKAFAERTKMQPPHAGDTCKLCGRAPQQPMVLVAAKAIEDMRDELVLEGIYADEDATPDEIRGRR